MILMPGLTPIQPTSVIAIVAARAEMEGRDGKEKGMVRILRLGKTEDLESIDFLIYARDKSISIIP